MTPYATIQRLKKALAKEKNNPKRSKVKLIKQQLSRLEK